MIVIKILDVSDKLLSDLYLLDACTNFIFQRIHGVIQSYTPEFFLGHVTGGIKHFGISDKVTCDAAELLTYHQGYNEPGYDRNTPQQLGKSVWGLITVL